MFGAFGPLQEHISPTRKDTPFNLIPNLIKKIKNKKRKEKKRETDERD